MTEITIFLEDVDPMVFFGTNNSQLDKIQGFFPKIRILARGNEIKCMGEESEIAVFAEKFNELVEYYKKYHRIDEQDIEKYFLDAEHMKSASNGHFENVIVFGTSGKPIRARTVNQVQLVEDYRTHDLIITEGPAGTGKTYTSIALAVRALKEREVKKIILTRPAVEAGERLGFLPGDMKEKLDPYLQPLYDALHDMLPFKKLETWLEDGTVQIAPLAFMRGRTLENAFVILDEAQNATMGQLKMFLTRMGMSSKFIMTGDSTQIDLPRRSDSGLIQAIRILSGIEGISIIRFDEGDIVRHKLVKRIVRAYENEENESDKPKNSEK
ncbi:MAG: phosphate starvation-inducible protein PhoH [Bacteroidetes bacterium GWE2_41_25]|nr:MAG: phosphate starvation-inducible protein PhoH [Bacteroidetes bacterium GWA2_40_15]OFX83890.1 MAG: phosphate starvation-inducible protein PhoH [Bacteroidetes bacterium GWC2_40_22]OFX99023.1 MAG: phosphate starvation-inducible protein PhoH [Bacteroidetes bacterium GWE2_41_25]OFY59817.1 MAG: phosphate starvation-inducible protein PhoH [Bacteroidetes bacterium GWF2_41_9]HBH83664.1 phosphate starvation-inducible protein PhoH [Bacteroidales bacterium]